MNLQRSLPACIALIALSLACSPAAPEPRAPLAAPAGDAAAHLTVPPSGRIPVAFVLSPGATVIDFTGPWEVFQDARGRDGAGFDLYTVAESRAPIRLSGGLQVVPDYTFRDAPAPAVIVVPAQAPSAAMIDWLRSASPKAELTTSVCTGAFVLAQAGLLHGRSATTHHEYYSRLAAADPTITVRRGVRFVEGSRIATAGGLTSGIDMALRIVERFFGHEAAQQTADYMEHTSPGWHRDAGVWDDAVTRP
jgi:transcriptional regulator GlxA family with amidase domain